MRTLFGKRWCAAGSVIPWLILAGCGSSTVSDVSTSTTSSPVAAATAATGSTAGTSGATLGGALTIFAAASLKKTFDELRINFIAANPGVKVDEISYDGSATLATQLLNGASADVFASADTKNMTKVADAKLLAGPPIEFATNTLQIVVAPGNPKKMTGLASLSDRALDVVLCAPEVPCGAAAHTALTAASVSLTPRSEEPNVSAVLTKVKSGDADAGLVYRTDVLAAGNSVTGVSFPEAAQAVNHYPLGVLADARNPRAAAAFVALVTGPTGRKVLADAGFGPPAT